MKSEETMATITEVPKISHTFDQKLDRLAQVAIHAGLGLERGQETGFCAHGTDSMFALCSSFKRFASGCCIREDQGIGHGL